MRRPAKLLVACPSAIREIGQTNCRLGSTKCDAARSCKWPAASSAPSLRIRQSTHCCRFPHDTGWTAVDPLRILDMEPRRWQHPDLPEWGLCDLDSRVAKGRNTTYRKGSDEGALRTRATGISQVHSYGCSAFCSCSSFSAGASVSNVIFGNA
jgi:hypothetical protein